MKSALVNKIFNRYLLVSLVVHLLILFMTGDYFNTPVSPMYRELQVEIRPPAEEKAKGKITTPVIKSKPKLLKKIIKRIPREIELPPRPIDDKAKLSMFKDGLGIQGKPRKRPAKRKESPLTTPPKKPVSPKKVVLARPGIKTTIESPLKKHSPPEKEKKRALTQKEKELFYPFKKEDLLVKVPPPAKPAAREEKGKLPELSQLLANLDEYIDVHKFDDSELFGESMLTFNDENFRYVWYGRIVKKKVVNSWYPPTVAKLGLTGKAVVTFVILRSGSTDKIKLKESTGNKSLDHAALNAIKSAGPFPKLPDDYTYNQLGVIFSFWYNLSRSGS